MTAIDSLKLATVKRVKKKEAPTGAGLCTAADAPLSCHSAWKVCRKRLSGLHMHPAVYVICAELTLNLAHLCPGSQWT